jgi:hypothetical protein
MLREQMNATMSRSDVLKPLAWLVGIVATATCAALFSKPPEWVLVALIVALLASITLYGLAYIFCLFMDRDALRSEKYSLHKLAIEHGIYGDSFRGVIEDQPSTKALPSPSEPTEKRTEGAT